MREIKFRAWDGKNMNYNPTQCTGGPEVTTLNSSIQVMLEPWHEPQYKALMQFTGLRDKTGKEIYEGDIVECMAAEGRKYKEATGVVVWNQAQTVFSGKWNLEEAGRGIWLEGVEMNGVTVIGNIHETPDLLRRG